MTTKTKTAKNDPANPISRPFGLTEISLPPRPDGTSRDGDLAAARRTGYEIIASFDNALPGDPRDTVAIARAALDRESRERAWAGAAKRGTIERVVNTLIDHALNRQEQMLAAETYARDLATEAHDGEIASVRLAEALERLATIMEDAALATEIAVGAWAYWSEHCGGDFRRFDNTYAAYRRRQVQNPRPLPLTAPDPEKAALLARLKRV